MLIVCGCFYPVRIQAKPLFAEMVSQVVATSRRSVGNWGNMSEPSSIYGVPDKGRCFFVRLDFAVDDVDAHIKVADSRMLNCQRWA